MGTIYSYNTTPNIMGAQRNDPPVTYSLGGMAERRLMRLLKPIAVLAPAALDEMDIFLTGDTLRQRIEQYQNSDMPREYKIAVGFLRQFPLVLDEEREEAAIALKAANDEFMRLHDLDVQKYPVSVTLGFGEPDNSRKVGLLQLAGMLEHLHHGAIIYGPDIHEAEGVLYDTLVSTQKLEQMLARFRGDLTQSELEEVHAECTYKRWTPLETLLADPRITRPVTA